MKNRLVKSPARCSGVLEASEERKKKVSQDVLRTKDDWC